MTEYNRRSDQSNFVELGAKTEAATDTLFACRSKITEFLRQADAPNIFMHNPENPEDRRLLVLYNGQLSVATDAAPRTIYSLETKKGKAYLTWQLTPDSLNLLAQYKTIQEKAREKPYKHVETPDDEKTEHDSETVQMKQFIKLLIDAVQLPESTPECDRQTLKLIYKNITPENMRKLVVFAKKTFEELEYENNLPSFATTHDKRLDIKLPANSLWKTAKNTIIAQNLCALEDAYVYLMHNMRQPPKSASFYIVTFLYGPKKEIQISRSYL